MFAKSTLASAVAAALGVSVVGIAQADSVFFPQVVLSDTVTTIVSVVNTSLNNWDQSGRVNTTHLHYRFYYKSGEAASNQLAACEEYNEYLPTSQYDLQTIDLSAYLGADTSGVLFNDPSINNPWQQSGRDYAFGRNVAPARGYLYIDNSDNDGLFGVDTLTGEAFVFEFGSGAAWGYQAYSYGNTPIDGADYTWAASASPSNVSIMPFTETTTAFFVTPVSQDQAPDFQNSYRARVELVTSSRGDLYDRDENLVSGTVPQDVVCTARVNATDLLTDGTLARLQDGGWGSIWNYRVDYVGGKWIPADFADSSTGDSLVTTGVTKFDADDGAVVIKLEYNSGATLNGEAVGGTFNNAIMLYPQAVAPFVR